MNTIPISVVLGLMLVAGTYGHAVLAANADAASETARLLGAWECSGSVAGSRSSQAYRRASDTAFSLSAVVRTAAGETGSVHESFAFDRANGVWALDAGKNRFYDAEHLTARAWANSDWVFTGSETAQGSARPVRVVYSSSDADTFVREHQVRSGDRWRADGTFVCRRAPLAAQGDGMPLGGDLDVPGINSTAGREAAESPASHVRSPAADASPPRGASSASRGSPAPGQSPKPGESTVRPVRVALALTPRPEKATPQSTAVSNANATDRAYSLTHGIWDCKTFGGADATHTYTRESDGSIELHNVLNIAKHDYAIDETYRYDRAKGQWTVATSGGAYAGVAGKWLTDKWVFEGDMPLDGHRVPVQMIYSKLGERAFRRDFVRIQDSAPATFAAETCELR